MKGGHCFITVWMEDTLTHEKSPLTARFGQRKLTKTVTSNSFYDVFAFINYILYMAIVMKWPSVFSAFMSKIKKGLLVMLYTYTTSQK